MRKHLPLLTLYVVAALAGVLFSRVGTPLPWMIGPLVITGALSASGLVTVAVPIRTRPIGQVTIATFVGAHFTPDALHSLLQTAPMLLTVSLFILVAAILVAQIQRRVYGTSTVTALLSVTPTSPVEAGVLAEHMGVNPGPVVLAQTARIALVVTVVPFLLQLGAPPGAAPLAPVLHHGSLPGLAVTLGGALLGPVLFRLLRFSNPFFLGPLFLAALFSSVGLPSYEIPGPLLAVAQIVLGTWLGSSFRRELLEQRGALIGSVLLSSSLLLGACVLGAWGLSALFGAPFPTVMLGIAPGGVTEMALTAGVLGQDVALVTAMHLTRIFVIMPNLGWIARVTHRLEGARRGRPEPGE